MNRRLFEDLVVSARGKRGARRGLALPASLGIHVAVVGGAVLLSALGPGDLMPEVTARPVPLPVWPTIVRVAAPPVAPAPPRPRPASQAGSRGPSLPASAPQAPIVTDNPLPTRQDEVLPTGEPCLDRSCLVGSSFGPESSIGVDPDGAGVGRPATVRAIKDVAAPVKIRNVDPVYPELARRTRVEGVVIIECTIDPKGRIANARVLRGHPLLDRAALDAVQQWVYSPSLLNNAPVSVIMTVTVTFRIAR